LAEVDEAKAEVKAAQAKVDKAQADVKAAQVCHLSGME